MRVVVCVGFLLVVCAVPRAVAAQDAQAQENEHAATSGLSPSIHLQGFMDIDYVQSDDPNPKAVDGFSLGQFVGHMSGSLG